MGNGPNDIIAGAIEERRFNADPTTTVAQVIEERLGQSGWEIRRKNDDNPKFYVLKIIWADDDESDVKAVLRSVEDCLSVVRRYSGWSEVSILPNGFDDPARF